MLIAIFTDVHANWPRYIHDFALASRTALSQATGHTPLFLNTGRIIPPPWDPRLIGYAGRFDKNNPEEFVTKLIDTIKRAHQSMHLQIQKNYERHRDIHNKSIQFANLSSMIWSGKRPITYPKLMINIMLAKKRDGPWRITHVHGGNAFRLEKLENGEIENSINIKDLVPYIPNYPIEQWEEGQEVATHQANETLSWLDETISVENNPVIEPITTPAVLAQRDQHNH
uniref:Uncharacterized protein n=1 Tax=Strigamia maritima TaxID=126957 RepID=T1IZQ3_STRMM